MTQIVKTEKKSDPAAKDGSEWRHDPLPLYKTNFNRHRHQASASVALTGPQQKTKQNKKRKRNTDSANSAAKRATSGAAEWRGGGIAVL